MCFLPPASQAIYLKINFSKRLFSFPLYMQNKEGTNTHSYEKHILMAMNLKIFQFQGVTSTIAFSQEMKIPLSVCDFKIDFQSLWRRRKKKGEKERQWRWLEKYFMRDFCTLKSWTPKKLLSIFSSSNPFFLRSHLFKCQLKFPNLIIIALVIPF